MPTKQNLAPTQPRGNTGTHPWTKNKRLNITPNSHRLNYDARERELLLDYKSRNYLLTAIKEGFHVEDPRELDNTMNMENYCSGIQGKFKLSQIISEIKHGYYVLIKAKPSPQRWGSPQEPGWRMTRHGYMGLQL